MYINQKHLASLEWVMLEIKLPREIFKSPLATEVALASLLQGGGIGHKYALYFNGALPAFSSLEIASIEGVIHFYIRIQKKFRPLVEANFYAQYPTIEIVEADDYTNQIRYHHLTKTVKMWGANYRTSKSWTPTNPGTGTPYGTKDKPYTMKADFLPIKTYVDYGLDKDPKEEFKTDPITPLLEMMGGIGKGEHMWYQILVQDEGVYNDKKLPKFYVNTESHEHVSLSDMAVTRKKQIRTGGFIKRGDIAYNDYGEAKKKKIGKDADGNDIEIDQTYTFADPAVHVKPIGKKEMDLTQDEKDEMEGMNKKLSKPLALVVMRFLYITKSENFNTAHIQDVLALPKPFNGINTFGLSPTDPYNYPWENLGKKRTAWRTEEKFEEYVEREGFFPHIPERDGLASWEDMFFWSSTMKQRKLFRMIYEAIFHPFSHPIAEKEVFTLNLEELATLWHLPGAVAATPTLPRIDSNKGVAPVNLPI